MKDRAGGDTKPMTMRAFRQRLEAKRESQPFLIDEYDWGGCGCFTG